mgnify:CR=1 FL=1
MCQLVNTKLRTKYFLEEIKFIENKNAKQYVQDVSEGLQNAQNCLNNALSSVEKPENKQQIENTLKSVDEALKNTKTTLSNYIE